MLLDEDLLVDLVLDLDVQVFVEFLVVECEVVVVVVCGFEIVCGMGVELCGLDKVIGQIQIFMLVVGQVMEFGCFQVSLVECCYLVLDLVLDVFVEFIVQDCRLNKIIFVGWMIVLFLVLLVMDDLCYDVWVVFCSRS